MGQEARLLRIYTDEAAYFGERKLYEVVAQRARVAGLAGATVLRALLGFGHTPHLHAQHLFDDDQSIVIEVVDGEERLRAFAESLSDMGDIGLITLQSVEVLRPLEAGR